jgi:hypothetical protein
VIQSSSVHLYVGVAVTLKNHILELLGSNLGLTAAILTEVFREFLQFTQENVGIVPQLAATVSFQILLN